MGLVKTGDQAVVVVWAAGANDSGKVTVTGVALGDVLHAVIYVVDANQTDTDKTGDTTITLANEITIAANFDSSAGHLIVVYEDKTTSGDQISVAYSDQG